jgi:Arc/MetJ family transcription regulator
VALGLRERGSVRLDVTVVHVLPLLEGLRVPVFDASGEGVELGLWNGDPEGRGLHEGEGDAEPHCETDTERVGAIVWLGDGVMDALTVDERDIVGEGVELALRQEVALALGHSEEDSEEEAHREVNTVVVGDREIVGEPVELALRQGVAVALAQAEGEVLFVAPKEDAGEEVELALRHVVADALGQIEEDSDEEEHGDAELLRLDVTVAQGDGEDDALFVEVRDIGGEAVELALRHVVADALGQKEEDSDAEEHGDTALLRLDVTVA